MKKLMFILISLSIATTQSFALPESPLVPTDTIGTSISNYEKIDKGFGRLEKDGNFQELKNLYISETISSPSWAMKASKPKNYEELNPKSQDIITIFKKINNDLISINQRLNLIEKKINK